MRDETPPGERIGDRLVASGALAPAQLREVLERQEAQGGYLGEHLLDAGLVARQELLDQLAGQWGLARRDLDREPPRPGLVDDDDLDRLLELGWLPCELTEDGAVVVATSVRPDAQVELEVGEYFPGAEIVFVACTRRDLDHVAVRRRGERTPDRGARAAQRSCRAACDLLLGGGTVLVLTGLLVAPPVVIAWAVAILGILALTGSVAQVWAALRIAVLESGSDGGRRAGTDMRPEDAGPDALLPVYSVLVPLRGGEDVLRRVLDDVAALDYPTSRLDAVLIVSEDDEATLEAVRRGSPPPWVRVAAVLPGVLDDPVGSCDEGLALARGRHVVAFAPDEVPEPGQLRRAVRAFEADLLENLEQRAERSPLAGLRVELRRWGGRSFLASGLEVIDGVLGSDRSFPWQGPGTDLRRDLTSVHCNTRVLRRIGGWAAVVSRTPDPRVDTGALRWGSLRSTSRSRRASGWTEVVGRRADLHEVALRRLARRARVLGAEAGFGRGAGRDLVELVLGSAFALLALVPPLFLVLVLTFLVRVDELDAQALQLALLGPAVVVLGLLLVATAAGSLAGRRHGWRASRSVVLLPAHWLVHATAAWCAVVVLLSRRPSDAAAALASTRGSGWRGAG